MVNMPVMIDGKRYAVRSAPKHDIEEIIRKNRIEREQLNRLIHRVHREEKRKECCVVM
jgi:hypothetical protein